MEKGADQENLKRKELDGKMRQWRLEKDRGALFESALGLLITEGASQPLSNVADWSLHASNSR
jgi:hypothetical protein